MATGTLVDVVMPQMGVSVSEGTITRWAKNVGEAIEADETIVEISTDKVDTEVPAPATGVVRELLAAEGETVPVNTRIAVIDTGGGGADQTEPGPDAAVVVAEDEATEGSDPQVAPSPRTAGAAVGARPRVCGRASRQAATGTAARAGPSSRPSSRAWWPSTTSTSTRSAAPAPAAV